MPKMGTGEAERIMNNIMAVHTRDLENAKKLSVGTHMQTYHM